MTDHNGFDEYSPRHSARDNPAYEKEQTTRFPVWMAFIGVGLLIAAAVVFFAMLIRFDALPHVWVIAGGVVMAVLIVLLSAGCDSRRNGIRILSFIVGILLAAVVGLGCVYLNKAMSTISKITVDDSNTVSTVSLVVLEDSEIRSLEDVSGGLVGITHIGDSGQINAALTQMEDKLGQGSFSTLEAVSYAAMADDLYAGNVSAMLLSDAHRGMVTDVYADFDSQTRIVATFEWQKPQADKERTGESNLSKKVILSEESETGPQPFVVYLTGIDTYGGVEAESRSDVNILAVVNPQTKELLLLTTPRDAYVELPMCGYEMDKLTHAGLFGVEGSIETLENLYGIEIDRYVRLNFSGFVNIVDALDGIEVYYDGEYGFETHDNMCYNWYSYEPGYNYLYGEAALAFVRCRDFTDGDFQRGKNQMAAIQAILDKVLSPSILTSYMSLMDSVSGCFTTDFTDEEISELVKMQLEDNARWTVNTVELEGWPDEASCYNLGEPASVVMLDSDSVYDAQQRICEVLGE